MTWRVANGRSAICVTWLACLLTALSACATWQAPVDTSDASLRARAVTETKLGVQLSATVLDVISERVLEYGEADTKPQRLRLGGGLGRLAGDNPATSDTGQGERRPFSDRWIADSRQEPVPEVRPPIPRRPARIRTVTRQAYCCGGGQHPPRTPG